MADDTELPALDPELGALISAYKVETARDATQVDAALARVTANAGTAGSGGAAALSTATKIGLVSGLVAIVGVVGIVAFGPASEPASSRPMTTQTAITSPESTAPPVVVETPHEAAVALPALAATTGGESPVVDEAPHKRSDRRPKPAVSSRPTRASEPPPAESTLKAELELLQRARGALRRGKADEALEIVRQHRREYPSSTIAKERDATEVSALCALGRLDTGACQ